MINAIGFFVGALVSSFILVQGVGWLLKKIGQDRLGLAHLITFAVSMNVVGYGLADGGEPKNAEIELRIHPEFATQSQHFLYRLNIIHSLT